VSDRYTDQFEDAADLAGALNEVEDVCREHGYDGAEPLDQWLRKLIAGIAGQARVFARERDDARATVRELEAAHDRLVAQLHDAKAEAGSYRALYERAQAEREALLACVDIVTAAYRDALTPEGLAEYERVLAEIRAGKIPT
jgi:transposase-like protein